MGVPAEELDHVNEILGAAERDYRKLEPEHTIVEECSPDRVLVELGAVGPKAKELRKTLIRDLSPLVRDAAKRGELLQLIDDAGPLLSGDDPKRVEILKIPTGYRVVERPKESDQPFRVREWQALPPEYQKILDALPRPPATPVPPGPPK